MNPIDIPHQVEMKDSDHLKTIAILHFVFAGLGVLGFAFLALHYYFMFSIMNNPEFFHGKNTSGALPQAIQSLLSVFYVFIGIILAICMALNVLSGIFIMKRINRLFSLIVAGMNCLQVPFGVALGVFTFIVLLRDSVRAQYSRNIVAKEKE